MSDYIFMLESHLDAGQNQAVAAIRRIATDADMNVWLTGGAMRDMLRGAPSRDLDFTVERGALAAGRALAESLGGRVRSEDPLKRWIELDLPGGTSASVANARTERYSKPGGKPQIVLTHVAGVSRLLQHQTTDPLIALVVDVSRIRKRREPLSNHQEERDR